MFDAFSTDWILYSGLISFGFLVLAILLTGSIGAMATVTASRFVSRSSHVNGHGAESKANVSQIGMRSQAMTHSGLRSLNKVDGLKMRSNAKAVARKAVKEGRPSRQIICGTGMNLIFAGCEVGPWCKTGGLGDVLGGLPPAMAVSRVL